MMQDIKLARRDLMDLANRLHGIDFRGYYPALIERRIELFAVKKGIKNIFGLKHELINNKNFALELEEELSIHTTAMFRDPEFFKRLSATIENNFSDSESLNIWHAGCSAGKEVYSLAILLHEQNLLERSKLFGTDISSKTLERAKDSIVPLSRMREFSQSYREAGGKSSLKDYFVLSYDKALLRKEISKNNSFFLHNLITDAAFNKFQLIVCRNMFIYYDSFTQSIMLRNMLQSLDAGGILCMGKMESLNNLDGIKNLRCLDPEFNIYQKN